MLVILTDIFQETLKAKRSTQLWTQGQHETNFPSLTSELGNIKLNIIDLDTVHIKLHPHD